MEIIDRLVFGVRWSGDGCGGSKAAKQQGSMMDTRLAGRWVGGQ